ncbi:MAG: transcriptional repressor, partial [Dermatophilaceae bacterium]|nr:transcriptional repressor [Dermatophilaceae bacterium]
MARAVERLREVGERLTPARYAVLRVVDAADRTDEHLTAEDIGARVGELEPAVHRATVYRTLTSLVDSG